MTYENMVLVVQSRITGRFLLVEGEDGWNWPSVQPHDVDRAMLHQAILEACGHMGIQHLPDDAVLEFIDVTERSKLAVFHCWISEELNVNPKAEWCSLFHFPEKCDPMVKRILNQKNLRTVLVNPQA